MRITGGLGMYMGLGDLADKLFGDTWLPGDAELRNYANGWGEVWLRGIRIGTLRPGGKNGRFLRIAPDPPSVAPTPVAAAPVTMVAAAPPPVAQIAVAPAPVAAVSQPAAQIPVNIPTVQTASSIAPAVSPVSTLVEASSSAPAIMPADTTATTTESSSNSKLIGAAALGIGGYALYKMFKRR